MKIKMIRKNLITLLFAFFIFSSNCLAQGRNQFPVVISVFNTASELPGTGYLGVFTNPIHPGISIGTEYSYKSNPHHQLF
jgi:hypothetical protein